MVVGAGFEPASKNAQVTDNQHTYASLKSACTNHCTDADLERVKHVWPHLPPALKAGILAIVGAASPEAK
jgi:hypothetical protein